MDNTVTCLSGFGSLATGIAMIQGFNSLKQLQLKKNTYSKIKEFTPTTLLKYLTETNQTTTEAFVAGELISEKPIISRYPLIWSQKKFYDLYEYNIKRLKGVTSQGVSQLSITDYTNKIDIWRNTNLNYQASLTHIWDKFKPKQLNIFQRLINFILKLFNQVRSERLFFRGFTIGELEREYGILAGDFYVIYGEIVLDKNLNKLFLQNPKHLLRSKKQLLQFLQRLIKIKQITLGALMIMFFILSYLFCLSLKNIILKFLKEREKQRLDKLRGLKYLEISNFECQICYERPRNIILKPCKHMTLCHICLQRLKTQKCPVCKTRIEDYIEVFIT